MNALDWRKIATLDTQYKQEAAIAEMDQLSSMPLSQISIDDSRPPVMHYGAHMPLAVSTPESTVTYKTHHKKTLIRKLSQVSLRVHYTLPYHL